jgi:4-carboxymuconolactone decarboxylase
VNDRLPPLPPEQWSAEQRAAVDEVVRGPRGRLLAPFVPLLRSPELMTHAQRMGEYLRYRNVLGQRLTELAILVTARQWSQPVEWAIHAPIAQREGIADETIAAIAEGRRPTTLADDEAVVHDFTVELHRDRAVSDATWGRALERLGERGVVDLIGVAGYYGFLAMVMNAARTPAPASDAAALKPLARSRGSEHR